MPLLDQLQKTLTERHAKGMLRNLTIHQPSTLSSTSNLADFSSNDYLSIATSSELKSHFLRRATLHDSRVGGSTGSRLLDGNNGTGEMEALERRLCEFFQAQDGLLCPSGWEANVSLFSTLPQKDDVILYDSLVHASVHDGLRRSRAKCVAFQHNDVDDFHRQLHTTVQSLPSHANVFLSIESLYSMDGDYAPLPQLLEVARRYFPQGCGRFWTVIDEAHSGGCFGPNGAGMAAEWGLTDESQDVLRVMTFGKGFGASGAVILCPSIVRHYLINYARPLIFSTAIPHSMLLLIHASLDVLQSPSGQDRRQRLYANCQFLKEELTNRLESNSHQNADHEGILAIQDLNGNQGSSQSPSLNRAVCNAAEVLTATTTTTTTTSSPPVSPIMPLLTPHHYTRPLALYLQKRGYLVRPITYPTVPMGKDRVRICVHSDNTPQQISGFANAVGDWLATLPTGATAVSQHSPPPSAAMSVKSRL